MDVPSPFLQLETGSHELKATTPDDARLWVREFDDPDEGDLSFWNDALHHDLTARGYRTLGDAEQVRDAAGTLGTLRSYAVAIDGTEHGYFAATFVLPGGGTVRIAEFIAPRERFDTLLDAVRASLATLGG